MSFMNLFRYVLAKMIWFAIPVGGSVKDVADSAQLSSKPVISWFLTWEPIMHQPHLEITTEIFSWLGSVMVKGLYDFDSGIETIFNWSISLLGWDGVLTSSSSPLHGLYMVLFIIGWALIGLGIMIVVWESITHSINWSKVLGNLFMIGLLLTILPLIMSTVNSGVNKGLGLGNIAQSAQSDVEQTNVSDKHDFSTDGQASLSVLPIHNNVIDKAELVAQGFNTDPDHIKATDWNTLTTAKQIQNVNFGESLDSDTEKTLGLDKLQASNHFDSATDPIDYELDEVSDSQYTLKYALTKLKPNTGMGTLNDPAYARYDVSWFPLIGQQLILAIVLTLAIWRVLKDIFELTVLNLLAPLVAAQSVRESKKLRDYISTVAGFFMSIALMFVVIRVYFAILAIVPPMMPTSWNFLMRGITTMIIYAAGGYVMFSGIAYIQRMSGITQGFGDEANHLGAAVMAGAGVASMLTMAAGGTAKGLGMLSNHSSKSNSSKGTNKESKDSSEAMPGKTPGLEKQQNGNGVSSEAAKAAAERVRQANAGGISTGNVPGKGAGGSTGDSNANNNNLNSHANHEQGGNQNGGTQNSDNENNQKQHGENHQHGGNQSNNQTGGPNQGVNENHDNSNNIGQDNSHNNLDPDGSNGISTEQDLGSDGFDGSGADGSNGDMTGSDAAGSLNPADDDSQGFGSEDLYGDGSSAMTLADMESMQNASMNSANAASQAGPGTDSANSMSGDSYANLGSQNDNTGASSLNPEEAAKERSMDAIASEAAKNHPEVGVGHYDFSKSGAAAEYSAAMQQSKTSPSDPDGPGPEGPSPEGPSSNTGDTSEVAGASASGEAGDGKSDSKGAVEKAGDAVAKFGAKGVKNVASYEAMHQFGAGQQGRIPGKESDRFDDD